MDKDLNIGMDQLKATLYNNDLYYRNDNKLYVYRNRKLIQINVPVIWNHKLNLFTQNIIPVISNDVIYRYYSDFEAFDGKKIVKLLKKYHRSSGMSFHIYKDCIYYFGVCHNERYSIINQRWTEIKAVRNSTVYLFDDKFYTFDIHCKCIHYNPDIDRWELLPILFPKTSQKKMR